MIPLKTSSEHTMATRHPVPKSLKGFLQAALGCSQEDLIVTFLDAIINVDEFVDSGSVLIHNPGEKKLVVFNKADFLFKKKFLDPKRRKFYPTEFGYFDGIAGRCFRTEEPQVYPSKTDKGLDAEFVGDSPIKNMICVPILTGGKRPFGVVSFHNNDPNKRFQKRDVAMIESYVDILAVALHMPHPELNLGKNVFIVHGRDEDSLRDLENLLKQHSVIPRVLERENKNAKSILYAIEELLTMCTAGFVLVTPDDEGRRKSPKSKLEPRARENVIFEMGMLFAKFREFARVAVLLKKPAKLPSDLAGIIYAEFKSVRDIEDKIVDRLHEWELLRRSEQREELQSQFERLAREAKRGTAGRRARKSIGRRARSPQLPARQRSRGR
jgi:predicted nucleotide-binding protein